jgi:hypothetical protein
MISIKYFKIGLIGAIISGIGTSLFFYFTFYNGLIPPVVRFFDAWIPAVVIFFHLLLIRSYREKTEPFHFWEALILGNFICCVSGLISGVLIWQISEFDANSFHNFLNSSIKYLKITEENAPENLKMKNLNLVIEEIRNTDPGFMVWDEVKKKVMYSFILAPLLGMILRRK